MGDKSHNFYHWLVSKLKVFWKGLFEKSGLSVKGDYIGMLLS